ncbi:cupin domain-containing protein [Streptomyces sp. NPDC051162]|uniref:cupin domain-containing protein n=1 Tax=Streptomyces sp. NPDC051162 TaxID=3154747 RepID=UPI003419E4E5
MIDAASWAARLGGESFLAQTLSRSHTLTRGTPDDAEAFRRLLSWDDLNTLIATQRFEAPRLRLAVGGEALPAHRYARPVTTRRAGAWQRIQPAELHERLAEGASFVLDSIEEAHPPIAAAAEGLEAFTRTPVQVNAYASWTPAEGFGCHWDDHCVVVCQLHGAKRWRIYGPTRQAPAWLDTEEPDPPGEDAEPVADEVLRPGDVLYLPRGWWHAVTADQGTPSLHLTFGLAPHTGADFLGWAVDQLRSFPAVRRDAPRFAAEQDQADYLTVLRTALLEVLDTPGVLARWAHAQDITHPGRARPSLPYVTALPPQPGIRVRLTCPRARLTYGQGTVTLEAAGTEWEFADPAGPVLEALAGGRAVMLGELAEIAALTLTDTAAIVTALIRGQAAAVTEGEHR